MRGGHKEVLQQVSEQIVFLILVPARTACRVGVNPAEPTSQEEFWI